jgi:hypothetical protein
MSLAQSMESLSRELAEFGQALEGLEFVLPGENESAQHPRSEVRRALPELEPFHDHALVRQLRSALENSQGWLESARTAAKTAVEACAVPARIDVATAALVEAHRSVIRLDAEFHDALDAPERVSELWARRREGSDAWRAWAGQTLREIDGIRQHLEPLHRGLLECWEDLAERARSTNVSVQAINSPTIVPWPSSHEPPVPQPAPASNG